MTIDLAVDCDHCGSYLDLNDSTYCDVCYRNLQGLVDDLENQVSDLQSSVEELQHLLEESENAINLVLGITQ